MGEDVKKTRMTLIQRLKDKDDESAWAEFYQFYWDLITGWARKYGCSPSLAQDIFQETMVCLLRGMSDFEYDPEKGRFRSYLKTIVLCRARDAFRRESRYIASSASSDASAVEEGHNMFEGMADVSAEFEPGLDNAWLQSVLSRALRSAYKKVDQLTYKSFCLYVLEGLPVKEVGKRLSIDRDGTVYQQKSRFLGILKKEFGRIVDELGTNEMSAFSVHNSDSLFTRAFEELVSNKPDYRETLIKNIMPSGLFDQIEFVREKLAQYPPPGGAGVFLLILKNAGAGKISAEWAKVDGSLDFGRSEGCGILLDSEDVSGLHASIGEEDGDFVIRDENSANGVFVNGAKIKGGRFLRDGDIVQIGSAFTLIFNIQAPEGQS